MANSQLPGTEYTNLEAAQLLGVSVDTLRRWVKSGKVTPSRQLPSGRARWSLADIDAIGRAS